MSVEIRFARPRDARQILDVTSRDFARFGNPFYYTVPTREQVKALAETIEDQDLASGAPQRLVVARDSVVETYLKTGPWKRGDAAPFQLGGLAVTRELEHRGWYRNQRGLFTLATLAEDNGRADLHTPEVAELVEASGVFAVETGDVVNIPVLPADIALQSLLLEHGAQPTRRHGNVPIQIGERVIRQHEQLWRLSA